MMVIPIIAGYVGSAAAAGLGLSAAAGTVMSVVAGAVAGALVAESQGQDWKMGAVTGAFAGYAGGAMFTPTPTGAEAVGTAAQPGTESAFLADGTLASEMSGVAPATGEVAISGTGAVATPTTMTPTTGVLQGASTQAAPMYTGTELAGGGVQGALAGGAAQPSLAAGTGPGGLAGTGVESGQQAMANATIRAAELESAGVTRAAEIGAQTAQKSTAVTQASADKALNFQLFGSLLDGMSAQEQGKAAQDRFNMEMAWRTDQADKSRIYMTPGATPVLNLTPSNVENYGTRFTYQPMYPTTPPKYKVA